MPRPLYFHIKSILFIALANLATNATLAQTEKIYWDEARTLQWEDYKGQPEALEHESALTTCNIEVGYKAKLENEKLVITPKVKAFFNPQRSWVNETHKNEQTLRHERVYFTITELFARKIRQAFAETNFDTETYKTEIKKITKENLDAMWEYRDKYGIETFFGSKKVEQAQWEKNIQLEMMELGEYTGN
ncbi:hypothetical protein R9C00_26440 [Flammeovirgaceae bacterium SG7u.111]|nr:hypothetical protein [Flammeovirgaceae bacterium SG7u.132]WPO35239.1 hypothetical protein R9C00_26440 [Flammeovirgaceae bacterium SG7u.111]